MLATGFMIFLGVGLIFAKLPRRTMLRALKHDLKIDLAVSFLVLVIHWGTFSGVMAAAVAGLMCSGFTFVARRLFGWIDARGYHPGAFPVQL